MFCGVAGIWVMKSFALLPVSVQLPPGPLTPCLRSMLTSLSLGEPPPSLWGRFETGMPAHVKPLPENAISVVVSK